MLYSAGIAGERRVGEERLTSSNAEIPQSETTPSVDDAARNDRQALSRLLEMGIAGAIIDLETNEELPRLIPVLCAYFSREELAERVGATTADAMLKMYRTEMLQNMFLEHELQRILHAFNQAGIPLLLFKGAALAHTIYPQPQMRTYHDIDGLLHEGDIPRARELLTTMGYEFYEEYRANAIDKTRSGYNFVLKQADSWLEVLIELHTAPHSSDIGSKFDIPLLWQRAQSITVLGEQALTMNPVDHLLYLCWHYRFHSFTRLLWLYDIVALLRAFEETLDWDNLLATARRQNMATTMYYCLLWCRDLFKVAVPARVLAKLHPPLLCRVLIERVTIPEPARVLANAHGQSRRVIAHHAMVDSSTRLLIAGLRTFFPPPALLARRYMEQSRLPLQLFFLYYLIHPWLTLAKGGRYLLKVKRGSGKR